MLNTVLCILPTAFYQLKLCSVLSDSVEGLNVTLQVRWYSFQFLMQQMAEDLTELLDAVSKLLQQMPTSKLRL